MFASFMSWWTIWAPLCMCERAEQRPRPIFFTLCAGSAEHPVSSPLTLHQDSTPSLSICAAWLSTRAVHVIDNSHLNGEFLPESRSSMHSRAEDMEGQKLTQAHRGDRGRPGALRWLPGPRSRLQTWPPAGGCSHAGTPSSAPPLAQDTSDSASTHSHRNFQTVIWQIFIPISQPITYHLARQKFLY